MYIQIVSTENSVIENYLKQNNFWNYFLDAKKKSKHLSSNKKYSWAYLNQEIQGKTKVFFGYEGFESELDNGYVHLEIKHNIKEKQKVLSWVNKLIIDNMDNVKFIQA